MNEIKFIRIQEATRIYALGRTKVYELVKSHDLHIHKVGSSSLLKCQEIETFLESCRVSDVGLSVVPEET